MILMVSACFIGVINLRYMALFICCLGCLGGVIYRQQKKAQVLRKERNELNVAIMRRFVKILMNKFEILQSAKIDAEVDDLVDALEENKKVNFKQSKITIWVDIVLRLLTDGTKILLIVVFGFGRRGNALTTGEFASLMAIAYFLEKVLEQFSKQYLDLIKGFVEIEKLRTTFDAIPRTLDFRTGSEFVPQKGNIEIIHISFAYTKQAPVFTDFSLSIVGGTKTAFVGESGGGKTTLLKLIA